MSTIRKITVMAILAAIGAAAGALGGELLFLGASPPEPEARSICLLFDVSGSMNAKIRRGENPQTQLGALQEAASEFVADEELRADAIGLVAFSSNARLLAEPSRDRGRLLKSIDELTARGATDMALGLEAASDALRDADGERWIVLFSDGKPELNDKTHDPVQSTLIEAELVRASGIEIVAIGTGLADGHFLGRVTGSGQNVILSDPQRLREAFERTRVVIEGRQMLASGPADTDFVTSLVNTAIWAGLIATFAGLAMVLAQNRHMRRRLLSPLELIIIVLGGALTGVLAGTSGQALFYALSQYELLQEIGRTLAWVVLGLCCGAGMSLFVPNLNRRRAASGGAVGGITAALLFLHVVPIEGDTAGRLASAAALGLFTAIALVILEATGRTAWLEVRWSPKEVSTLRLGDQPILVGHSSSAHICPEFKKGGDPITARIEFQNGEVVCHDVKNGGQRRLRNGDTVTFGRIEVQAHIRDEAPAGPTAPPEPPPARERERTRQKPEKAKTGRDRELAALGTPKGTKLPWDLR